MIFTENSCPQKYAKGLTRTNAFNSDLSSPNQVSSFPFTDGEMEAWGDYVTNCLANIGLQGLAQKIKIFMEK